MSDTDCMVESQAEYIENLQQQIFVLENEVAYLYPFLFTYVFKLNVAIIY